VKVVRSMTIRFLRRHVTVAATVLALASATLGGCGRGEPQESVAASSARLPPEPLVAARGMWVWATAARLTQADGITALLESCRTANLNEVYLSVGSVLSHPRLPELVAALRARGIRVEALVGDATWYQLEHRSELTAAVDSVAAYNATAPENARFVAIHFDVEPHQLAENKVSHAFLPALADALRAGSDRAASRGLYTSADLPRFALQESGAALAAAVPRIFVMLYELRDRSASALADASAAVFDATYGGLPATASGRMVIGISVDDYPRALEGMLGVLDTTHADRPRYAGWAIHDEAHYRATLSGR